MNIQTIDIKKLKPAAYNPRKNLKPGDAEYEKLSNSIEAFGYIDPVIWNERTGNVVGGHQRLKILAARGDKQIECSVVDLDELSEKALNIALNKIAGEFDFSLLADLLLDLDTNNYDMDLTGFGEDELKQVMAWTPTEDDEDKYTQKITPPIYEPKGNKPSVEQLFDSEKTSQLETDIDKAELPDDIARFLKTAAQRHTKFHFGHIAEYYCHATPEVQELMECSGLIIIDYDKAIECGFVHLVEELKELANEEEPNA